MTERAVDSVIVPFKKRLAVAGAAALVFPNPALAVAQPSFAAAGAGTVEADTGVQYAERAYRADDINAARTDMQEAINCLVGLEAKRPGAAAGNPCTGQGDGAIRDIKGASFRQQLQLGLGEASLGIQRVDLPKVRMDALSAVDYMQSVRIRSVIDRRRRRSVASHGIVPEQLVRSGRD